MIVKHWANFNTYKKIYFIYQSDIIDGLNCLSDLKFAVTEGEQYQVKVASYSNKMKMVNGKNK